jgi:hypothetical protein
MPDFLSDTLVTHRLTLGEKIQTTDKIMKFQFHIFWHETCFSLFDWAKVQHRLKKRERYDKNIFEELA